MSEGMYRAGTSLMALAELARIADTDDITKSKHNHAMALMAEAQRATAAALTIITGREVKP